jgi:hypothetical protein
MIERPEPGDAPSRAQVIEVLQAYEALHAAIRRLSDLAEASRGSGDGTLSPNATVRQSYNYWRDLNLRFNATLDEVVRIDADLAALRRTTLGEPTASEQ